ncbi:MAG: hypothetical protein HYW88_02810, partial [Candidatus Sungbacteria bacterium]|nr:hypothetical protein [Candidatus Sungbacteria bacterium]
PPPTRSRFQVEVHKRFGLTSWDWQRMHIDSKDGNDGLSVIHMNDPTIPWETYEMLLADDRKEFLKKCAEAGIVYLVRISQTRYDRYRFIELENDIPTSPAEPEPATPETTENERGIEQDEAFLHRKWVRELEKRLRKKKPLTEDSDKE